VQAGHEVIISNLRDPRSAIRARTRIAIRYADEQAQLTKRFIWPIQLSFMDGASVVAVVRIARGIPFLPDRPNSDSPPPPLPRLVQPTSCASSASALPACAATLLRETDRG
jgi:hypothetical protein